MKLFILSSFFSIFLHSALGQSIDGVWKGSMYANGTSTENGWATYIEIQGEKTGSITGRIRNETYNTNDFAIKNFKGTAKNGTFTLNETVVSKKATGSKTNWCRVQLILTYNKKTGYLEGSYNSSECRNFSGKVVFYQEGIEFPEETLNPESHHWFDVLAKDIKKGLTAPKIRKAERESFVFSPIYFDYDKAEIKQEFTAFLDRLIHVVEGHSDLRIKVTGHTDSDGSDAYNDGLSKRRAQAIIDYFVSKGVSADRLEFDFKGEKIPAASNDTPEGRQQNRRVDFQFI